jgi:hypothetical protein
MHWVMHHKTTEKKNVELWANKAVDTFSSSMGFGS